MWVSGGVVSRILLIRCRSRRTLDERHSAQLFCGAEMLRVGGPLPQIKLRPRRLLRRDGIGNNEPKPTWMANFLERLFLPADACLPHNIPADA